MLLLMSACSEAPAPHIPECSDFPAVELLDGKLRVEGATIYDQAGRQVLLRGVNAGGRSKYPPFIPFSFRESGLESQADAPAFEDALAAYADRVQTWGHRFVRLPFTWEAVEPERGLYDLEFLGRYEAMIEAFAARGIYVLVDFHQDVYARPFCGDGFPLWTLPSAPSPMVERDCHEWFLGYLRDDEVRAAYDHFWNDEGLQHDFAAMWRVVAERFWPYENVVGFEVINEPGWGTRQPADFQPNVLTPFYSRLIGVIREVAPDAPIFFDSSGTDAVSAQTALERPDGEGLVFAPHFYDPRVILEGQWSGDSTEFVTPLSAWSALGDEWNVPVLLGEFGIRREAEGAPRYLRLNYEAVDALLMHATLWEYSATVDDWNDEGMSVFHPETGEGPGVAELIRAYPSAVAGTLISFSFDRDTRVGQLVFEATSDEITEIIVPDRLYPEGVLVHVEGPACAVHDGASQRLRARADLGMVTIDFEPSNGGMP